MTHFHAVVWIDHREAHVFHLNDEDFEARLVRSHAPDHKVHHHAGSISGKRSPDDERFMHAVVEALGDAGEWLVVGPGNAKLEFVKHVTRHDHQLADRIVGVETAERATDRQIVAHARAAFHAIDRRKAQLS
jgi:stalled ribosome rescue protein Dom34